MEKLKKYLFDFFTVIGGLAVIWEYAIKPLYKAPANMTLQEHYLHNWTTPAGVIILVIVVLFALRKMRNIEKLALETKSRYNMLKEDMASFAHYQQGLLGIAGKDYPGAYFNFVHAIKFTINANNIQNIPRILKMLKEQILPYCSKDDLQALKIVKSVDIEEAFKHIAAIDSNNSFSLGVQEVREIINRLPQSLN